MSQHRVVANAKGNATIRKEKKQAVIPGLVPVQLNPMCMHSSIRLLFAGSKHATDCNVLVIIDTQWHHLLVLIARLGLSVLIVRLGLDVVSFRLDLDVVIFRLDLDILIVRLGLDILIIRPGLTVVIILLR